MIASPAWAGMFEAIDTGTDLKDLDTHQHHLGSGQTDSGGVGLMQTPSARMAPIGEFSLSYNYVEPYRRYSISLQPADWFEFTFRYTKIDNRLYGSSIAGDRSYLDKGLDAKLRLWEESRYLPEVALGVRDAGGTTLFGAEYLVASKRWYDLDFSLGLGWGYLGTRGDMVSPLGVLDDRFKTRPTEGGGDQGGEFALNQIFRGPAAIFGGIEYQTPWDPLVLQLEYEGNDYTNEPSSEPLQQDSPLNIGARYHLNDSVALQAGWERGNTLMTGITLSANLAGLSQVKRDPEPITISRATAPAEPSTSRPQQSSTSEVADSATGSQADWRATTDQLLTNAGIRVNRILVSGDTLVVEGEPTKYRSLARTEGRANRILHNNAPDTVTTFRYRWQSRGLNLRDDVHSREAFVEAAESVQAEPDYYYGIYTTPAKGDAHGEVLADAEEQRFEYNIGPGYNQNLGGPDGYLYQLLVRANGEYMTDPNGWFSGTLGWTVADNFDKYDYVADSELPRVRTYIGDYLAESSLGITNLQYTRTKRLGDNWFAMGYGGLLEMMYAGVGSEVLYRPFNSDWALGADLNYVHQREFDQQFGLRDYSTWTGHLSAYVQTDFEDVLAKVSVGRYLAKDIGTTIDLSREFASGARMGAWATFTDAGDKFGEGSFDKGVYISLPLDAFFTSYSRDRVSLAWQPLTRDGGARLDRRYSLYGMTEDRELDRFWENREDFWE
ncbi:YjbH domain-containing protein [Onishia niordana]|uniref:YjbH domain-containing protein n=1 Tax=Onishia niordana TaxID=2508711 RepID=UPI00109F22DE|nr:YjbH domain-containing protein [Halomonas niordiana]